MLGVQYQRWDQRFLGQGADTRGQPMWSQEPFVDANLPTIGIEPRLLRNILAAYLDHRYQAFTHTALEGSARVDLDSLSGQWTHSFLAGVSQGLPTATVVKASVSG